jgi:hypothetical protein
MSAAPVDQLLIDTRQPRLCRAGSTVERRVVRIVAHGCT